MNVFHKTRHLWVDTLNGKEIIKKGNKDIELTFIDQMIKPVNICTWSQGHTTTLQNIQDSSFDTKDEKFEA